MVQNFEPLQTLSIDYYDDKFDSSFLTGLTGSGIQNGRRFVDYDYDNDDGQDALMLGSLRMQRDPAQR
jgi:hypothetical protein